LKPRLVIDASVVVRACLEVDGFGPLAGHALLAPPLVASEALSALHEGRFRGELSRELAHKARERLGDAPIELVSPGELAREAWTFADVLGWAKTYDAEYVALAKLLDCPLVTLDARLSRGAGQTVRIVGPADVSV
jgi:predicted nucleic acid-binding protein